MSEIQEGYCQCGCGGKTSLRKGKYSKFIHNHHQRKTPQKCYADLCEKTGAKRGLCENHYQLWRKNGDPNIKKKGANGDGYLHLGYAGKQRNGVRVFDHVVIAETVLGKPLPAGAVIHHVNEIRAENKNTNLVICQDRAYHNLLHARMRALKSCGNANWKPCRCCKKHDDIKNLHKSGNREVFWHKPYGSCIK